MKIKTVVLNNYKKQIEISTAKNTYTLPFAKLDHQVLLSNPIQEIYIDKELGSEAVTYILKDGSEHSIHLDIFLDYNKDPDFLKMVLLYQLSSEAQQRIHTCPLSKNEICRRLKTSPSQLSRLLSSSNTSKSIDKMIALLSVLGAQVSLKIK